MATKGQKLEGYDKAVKTLQSRLNKHRTKVYTELLNMVDNVSPNSIAQILDYLIETPLIRRELSEAGDARGMLRFIEANVGEDA